MDVYIYILIRIRINPSIYTDKDRYIYKHGMSR